MGKVLVIRRIHVRYHYKVTPKGNTLYDSEEKLKAAESSGEVTIETQSLTRRDVPSERLGVIWIAIDG